MNNRYIKPVTGAIIGGLFGGLAIYEAPTDKEDLDNIPAYCAIIFACVMLGGIIGSVFNGRHDPNSPEEVRKNNNKILQKLKAVFDNEETVTLLTQQEDRDYSNIIQNKPPAEIARINLLKANYEAAIDEVKDISDPVTLIRKSHPHTAVTYSYQSLTTEIASDIDVIFRDPVTELAVNRKNFSFSKNYAPEVMDFIKEVRATLRHHANATLPSVYRENNGAVIFQQARVPKTSRYAQLTTDETGNLRTITVARLNF